jgi:hypothetical protein
MTQADQAIHALHEPGGLAPTRALLFGALTVGGLDLLDAFVFFGLRSVSPTRILQSIASGLLGRSAFNGGLPVAALGLLLHFTVAFLIVFVFFALSRNFASLHRRPWVYGPLYGVVAWAVMNFVVIPLSAANRGAWTLPVVANGLVIHMLGVGLPAALFSRAAFGDRAAGGRVS